MHRFEKPPPPPAEFRAEEWTSPPTVFREGHGYELHWAEWEEVELLPDREWRALSTELSPDVFAGFDLDGLRLGVLPEASKRWRTRVLKPFKDPRIHIARTYERLPITVTALCLNGELDRVAAGCRPLQRIPFGTHRIAWYQYYQTTMEVLVYFAHLAGRAEIVGEFEPHLRKGSVEPVNDVAEFHHWSLYLTPDELVEAYPEYRGRKDYTERYLMDISGLVYVWVHGGAERLTTARCRYEIHRLIQKVFATPGYGPWSGKAYPYVKGSFQ